MAKPLPLDYRLRVSFGKSKGIMDVPDQLNLNVNSFNNFLDKNSKIEKNLDNTLKSIFPIDDVHGRLKLDLIDWSIKEPKFDYKECKARGVSYTGSITIKVRLTLWDIDENTGDKLSVRDIKEQEIYVGEIPMITDSGSFIINGVERVIVGQLHRSAGIIFKPLSKAGSYGQFYGQIIPERGSWIEFETDAKDIMFSRIDRKKKFPSTILLKALGFTESEILKLFYKTVSIKVKNEQFFAKVSESIVGFKSAEDVLINSKVIVKAGKKITKRVLDSLHADNLKYIPIMESDLFDKIIATKIVSSDQERDLICDVATIINADLLSSIKKQTVKFDIVYCKYNDNIIVDTIIADRYILNKKKALISGEISEQDLSKVFLYTTLRPGEHATLEEADKFFSSLFFDFNRYDLSLEGRMKINETLGIDIPNEVRILTKDDFIGVIKHLILLENDIVVPDDVDSLSNKRVNLVGELMYHELRKGLLRTQRLVRDKMIMKDIETITPYDLINTKPISSAIRDFFATNQLSQFLDQTNVLSEISHKRRLSALGAGGLTRERAGFEVRDVNPTHYGRICPIETPEGPNIGLISSLAVYARINSFGFIETPYRKVKNGVVSTDIEYYTASNEASHVIAQANAPLNKDGSFVNEYVSVRKDNEFMVVPKDEVDLMDVATNQIVSVAAGLIPFLEHDDANRALMGSNMQRQAVPLLRSEAPIVGTGMEYVAAKYSRHAIIAKRAGKVLRIDDSIYISHKSDAGYELDKYPLERFLRSNQDTCLSQNPIVNIGDYVNEGQIIADGPSMEKGELAIGKNLVVAFMPWRGYNYEDGVTISRRVVEEDMYTSIHIKEFQIFASDTKFGPEEITADIPNASSEVIRNLDKNGIVRIGSYVKPGDVLVGKVTPKAETHYSPEERLLRTIFGEKSTNVSDSSLKASPDMNGIVVDVKILKRRGVKSNDRKKEIDENVKYQLKKNYDTELNLIKKLKLQSLMEKVMEHPAEKDVTVNKERFKKGHVFSSEEMNNLKENDLKKLISDKVNIEEIDRYYENRIKEATIEYERKLKNLSADDSLPPGVIMGIKGYVATKRRLSVGDKMSGRHGNKGVVSKILPVQDLPFLEDGTPVDIVLNPLGVPSRMNIGQIMETHLGWLGKGLGKRIDELIKSKKRDELKSFLSTIMDDGESDDFINSLSDEKLDIYAKDMTSGVHFANPIFEGAKENDIEYLQKVTGFKQLKSVLYDGVTGEKFIEPVTVGVMYVLKLHHLVDDKVHARSIGPYSLVTQQPLGGKAQFGGQRFGEMEVWSLEGYGASYALQEMLTVKSDDVSGRNKAYESIVKGRSVPLGGVPESFNVLVKEMRALGLDLDLLKDARRKIGG